MMRTKVAMRVFMVLAIAMLLTACQGKIKNVTADMLSQEDLGLMEEAAGQSYNSAPVYDFPEDPINVEIMTKVGHYFIGFNYNVIEFSSDEACKTFSMDNGKELTELICNGELRVLEAITFTDSSGEQVKCDMDEWICVNGSSKIYPPENWNDIVEYCEELETIAKQ